MTREEAVQGVKTLLEQMKALLEMNGVASWRMKWDILKNDALEFAQAVFQEDSTEYSIIRKALYPRSAFIYGTEWENFCGTYGEPVTRALALVKHRLEKGQTVLSSGEPDEHLIAPGTPHSAYVLLRDIIQSASTKVFLVDPYVDSTLFSLLSNVQASVETRILTKKQNLRADFAEELRRFVQEKGMPVEARVGLNDFHDRFLVIDDHLFFSGASFKDVGKKGSVVAEMKDIRDQTMKLLEKMWDSASLL